MCEILAGAVGGGWTMPPGGIPATEPEPRNRPVSINSVLCIVINPAQLQALGGAPAIMTATSPHFLTS
jgi:hypothetical protein